MEATLLEEAIRIAVEAHRGQKDRAGQPYILHPLSVMARVKTPRAKMVAILHDVLEDTKVSRSDLEAAGIPHDVLGAVECLTKKQGEAYDSLIARAKANSLARVVKIADLEDNMDIRRNGQLGQKDLDRLNKYQRAWETLMAGPPS
jgi:(p)ppGpp synthase/HD superfamily hydrolase